MSNILNKTTTIGIYGDGQLARLLASSATLKGLQTVAYSLKASDSPCQGVVNGIVEGKAWNDDKAFLTFIKAIDVLVLENEFIPSDFVFIAEKNGITCFPNGPSYEAVSNKLKQVNLAQKVGVKTPKTFLVEDPTALATSSTPLMLKALRGGYDGYGNFLLNDQSLLPAALKFLEKAGPTLAQEVITFEKEVAVMVVRAPGSPALAFPVVETIQENNICHFTVTPARIDDALTSVVQKEAMKLIEGIDGVGLFGIEFFIRGRDVIFNEIAPRPHNSAHLTMEACNISQFDALVYLATNRPVPNPTLKIPSAGMLNLLGTRSGPAHFEGEGFSEGFLHLYGKKESRPGRKMGHYTLVGNEIEAVLKKLTELKTRYQI